MADRTDVAPEVVEAGANVKATEADALGGCAAAVGGAGAVALAMNPGSMAAIGIVAACGVVGAFLVGNSKAVKENSDALHATVKSFGETHEQNTTAASGLIDAAGTGVNSRTWARG
jgi:hypothetical protein